MDRKITGILLLTAVLTMCLTAVIESSDSDAYYDEFYENGVYYHTDYSETEAYVAGVYGEITDLVIPEEVRGLPVTTIIGDALNSDTLESVNIPASMSELYDRNFIGCNSLKSIHVDPGNQRYSSDANGVLYNKSGTVLIKCPQMYRDEFWISSTVEHISGLAFVDCTNLTSVSVNPKNDNFMTDESGVLYNKDMTDLILCPSAFDGKYDIPEGVETIWSQAFKGCPGLTSISFPNGISVPWDAFDHQFYTTDGRSTFSHHAGYGFVLNGNENKFILVSTIVYIADGDDVYRTYVDYGAIADGLVIEHDGRSTTGIYIDRYCEHPVPAGYAFTDPGVTVYATWDDDSSGGSDQVMMSLIICVVAFIAIFAVLYAVNGRK